MDKNEAYKLLVKHCKVYPFRDVELYGYKKEVLKAVSEAYRIGLHDREKIKANEPFPGFWARLYDFVENIEVCDAMSDEEKHMILNVCRNRMPFINEIREEE